MPGSAGGPDGSRPQHLKELTSALTDDAGQRLLARLTEFTNPCLSGRVAAVIQPVFNGAAQCEQHFAIPTSSQTNQLNFTKNMLISMSGHFPAKKS